MPIHLLIVEDDAGIAANLRRFFVRRRFEVRVAESAVTARELLAAVPVDILLVDLDSTRILPALGDDPRVVVGLTAYDREDPVLLGVLGVLNRVDAVVQKPVDLNRLEAILWGALDSRHGALGRPADPPRGSLRLSASA